MSNTFTVRHSSIVVPDYNVGDCPQLEKMLSIWDDVYFQPKPLGMQYNEDTKTLYLPRGMDVSYIEYLLNRRHEMDYEHDPADNASIRLKVEPRNEMQQNSIAFLVGEGKFSSTKKKSQLALNLATGEGKTYCLIAGLSFMRTKAMILTHADSIKAQWKESLLKMTDVLENQILNVDGSKVVRKIMKMEGPLPWKIFLINRRTLYSYAKKEGWDAVDAFMKKTGVGVKVYDEAHLEFETLMHIDFHSNTKKTIYLTANFERSEYKENSVFKLSFKNIPKHGDSNVTSKGKHIIYVPIFYNSNPSDIDRLGMRGIRGWFDKNKYTDYQVQSDKFYKVLEEIITKLYKSNENKLLIMTSKIDSTEAVSEYIKNRFPEYSCGKYNSSMKPEDKLKTLEGDIISSTPKSLGTGNDIPGLRFIINSEPYTSSVQANQTAGRLRALDSGAKTFYIELIDEGFPDVVRMYKKRLPVFKKKCEDIMKLRIKL